MYDNYNGSIAQKNVQFPIETVIEPLAGENYSKAMIFCPVSLAPTYLPGITSPAAGNVYSVTSSSYGTVTGGLLKTWLVPFFKYAGSVTVGIAVYDDGTNATTNTLALVYAATKMFAYFKFGIADPSATTGTTYQSVHTSLAALCLPDTLYSDLWIGTADSNVLTSTSTLITALNTISSNARVIYNPDATINPALAQLGRTLASANTTGTPVGNSIDNVAFTGIGPSGADDADGNPTNLSATDCAALDAQHIGYDTYVGDGTSNVATEGSLNLLGEMVGANWVRNYITYVCKVRTANYITQINRFRNNATYQGILLILTDVVSDFLKFGRLDAFQITAPVFADLPASGDQITVPNAWQATYIDNAREVTVYGTLYMTMPTR